MNPEMNPNPNPNPIPNPSTQPKDPPGALDRSESSGALIEAGATTLRTFRERAAAALFSTMAEIREHIRGFPSSVSRDELNAFRLKQAALQAEARLHLNAIKTGRYLTDYTGPKVDRPRRTA